MIPSFIEEFYNNAINKACNEVDKVIKNQLIKRGFGDWETEEEYHSFLKHRVTMLTFDGRELCELWVDWQKPTATIIFTMENTFEWEHSNGYFTITYK